MRFAALLKRTPASSPEVTITAAAIDRRVMARDQASVMAKYGGRLSRETLIYAIGMFMVFPLGFIQVVVFTRMLKPAQYGDLGVLMVFAGLATLVMNTGSLQGTFMWTFGTSGTADGVDVGIDLDDEDAAGAEDKRRALGTGLLMTIAVCVLIGAPVIAFSSQVSSLLLGKPRAQILVEWATASAVLGALWRLTVTALRHERRPVMYSMGQMLRPIAVVAIAAPLVASGYGIRGALIGTALGSAVGIVFCFLVDHKSYALAFDRADAVKMARLGAGFIGIVIGLWIVHDADLYLVSWYASHTNVGLYRLASRIATLPSYFVSAFMFAQSSLERSMLFHATYELSGRSRTKSTLLTYYVFCALWLVLGLGVGADLLVHVAAPSYRGAAKFIPVLGLAYACYGFYVVVIRAAKLPHRRVVYAGSALAAAALFVASGIVMIPLIGPLGAPIGEMFGLLGSSMCLLWLMRRYGEPLSVQTWRIARALAAGVVCYLIGARLAPDVGGVLRWALEILSLLLYPVLLVAFGAVPRSHLAPLASIVRALAPRSRRSPLLDGVSQLAPRRRMVLEEVVRDRRHPADVAAAHRVSEWEVGIRLARALRQLVGVGPASEDDGRLGRYLLSDESPADHDSHARLLAKEGVDPLDIHELDAALVALRRAPRRAWKT